MESTFKVGKKIKEAWPLFTNNLAVFFLIFAFIVVSEVVSKKGGFFLSLIFIIISVFISYMIIRFLISIVDKKQFNPFSKSSLPTLNQLWNFIKTYILSFVIGMATMLIFIIPAILLFSPINILANSSSAFPFFIGTMVLSLLVGIYISTRLTFAVFISVDKNQGARKSIKESWNMTKGNFWDIFLKLLVIGLFSIVGIIGFFIGILVTYPLGMIVIVMLYKHYRDMKEGPKEEVGVVLGVGPL